MSPKSLAVVLVLAPALALAQVVTPPAEFTPPPMVPASPPPMPAPEPNTPGPGVAPATPPPPGSYVPGQGSRPGYQYSPYGTPRKQEKPAPEIGLMVSESLFGALTGAGIVVLPYFLLFNNGALGDPTLSSILFVAIFGAAPLAVAQTQLSLANGSRYYQSELWVPALTGLVGMAGVLGIFYASAGGTYWLGGATASGGVSSGGSVAWLMIGSIGVVPILQMVAINLFKQPKLGAFGVIGDPDKGLGVAFAPPTAAPIIGRDALGVQLSLLSGRF